jgi:hypothetical protein
MGVLNWLKQKVAGEDAGALTFKEGEENFEGLNMKEVIDAHLGWKGRLERVLDGSSTEQLDPAVVGRNDQCALGVWIGSSALQFSKTHEYQELVKAHDNFHSAAAKVLHAHHDGNSKRAADILTADFNIYSSRVQMKIIELYSTIYKRQGKL